MECSNCYTKYSTVWRDGCCNACGIYYKRHKIHKNVIEIYAKILINLKNK